MKKFKITLTTEILSGTKPYLITEHHLRLTYEAEFSLVSTEESRTSVIPRKTTEMKAGRIAVEVEIDPETRHTQTLFSYGYQFESTEVYFPPLANSGSGRISKFYNRGTGISLRFPESFRPPQDVDFRAGMAKISLTITKEDVILRLIQPNLRAKTVTISLQRALGFVEVECDEDWRGIPG